MVRFYYGLSGTFKQTTIEVDEKNQIGARVIYSMIKPWKKLESDIPPELYRPSHLNFSFLHLCNLEHTLRITSSPLFLVERGVTDSLFFWSRDMGGVEIRETIEKMVDNELRLCKPYDIEKILLIQKDENFIRNVILKEPTRSAVFKDGLKTYLEDQDKYIEFTKKYNTLTKIIEITNAKDYLENTLGIKYEESWK